MTYRIFALANNPGRVCVSRSETDNPVVRDLIAKHYRESGYVVTFETEE